MREIQRTHGVGWRRVRDALDSAWPKPRAAYPQRTSRLDPFKAVIDDMLVADLDAPRKQRHTATRIFDRLVSEHDATGISYRMVRDHVATRRPEIRVGQGRGPAEAFVPQTHLPGREAEVDFGEVAIRSRGDLVTCYLFCLRLSYSGKAVHRISASAGQEAFFEGHAHAFTVLGRVPAGKIRDDNLKAAVARVRGCAGSPAPGLRPTGGRRSGPTTTWRRSTASAASKVRTGRVASRAGRLVPPQPPGPRPRGRFPRGVERADRPVRPRRR